jgi:hypothetical protein
MTSDLSLIETACIPCLYKPVFGTERGKSSSAASNSQTTLPKLIFTDCWDSANPNKFWVHSAPAILVQYFELGRFLDTRVVDRV